MKCFASLLALIVTTSPAAAQQADRPRSKAQDAARLRASPVAQDLIAAQITSLAGIVLDTKVGPLAAFADPRDHVRSNDTLHSVERRRDPDYDRRLYERSHHVVATAGAVVGGAVTEAAELQRTADRLRTALTPLIEAAKTLSSAR